MNINTLDLIPMDAKTILQVSKERSANIAAANARVDMFKSDAQKMKELADGMRKVIQAQCESYKKHVTETFLDCDYKKIKVSKRIAKPRKKDFAGGSNKWAVCK